MSGRSFLGTIFLPIAHASGGVFDPKGPIAGQERDLIVTAVLLMLLVVVPLLIIFFAVAWKYRAGNTKAKYEPERAPGVLGELIWWAIPAVLVAVLALITWKATHALDPSKPLQSTTKPLTIQVVALDWKWLFIYPEQRVATVNFIQFPVATPLHFELTADAPMNSFWIPQLGGQIYAMSGMTTQLNLMADVPGEYAGRAAEINGKGYAGMTFVAKATSQSDFDAWVASVKLSSPGLTVDEYNKLAAPSEDNPKTFYSFVDSGLYNSIVMKFAAPTSSREASGLHM